MRKTNKLIEKTIKCLFRTRVINPYFITFQETLYIMLKGRENYHMEDDKKNYGTFVWQVNSLSKYLNYPIIRVWDMGMAINLYFEIVWSTVTLLEKQQEVLGIFDLRKICGKFFADVEFDVVQLFASNESINGHTDILKGRE